MRNQHRWILKNEDGLRTEWQATKFAGRWEFKQRLPDSESWETVKNPSSDLLSEFRDVLWRKYQRRRCPYEDVVAIERLRDVAGNEEAG